MGKGANVTARSAQPRTASSTKCVTTLAILASALAMSGCSILPAAGPTTSAIESGADIATAEHLGERVARHTAIVLAGRAALAG